MRWGHGPGSDQRCSRLLQALATAVPVLAPVSQHPAHTHTLTHSHTHTHTQPTRSHCCCTHRVGRSLTHALMHSHTHALSLRRPVTEKRSTVANNIPTPGTKHAMNYEQPSPSVGGKSTRCSCTPKFCVCRTAFRIGQCVGPWHPHERPFVQAVDAATWTRPFSGRDQTQRQLKIYTAGF
jgi:hypothetical protein